MSAAPPFPFAFTLSGSISAQRQAELRTPLPTLRGLRWLNTDSSLSLSDGSEGSGPGHQPLSNSWAQTQFWEWFLITLFCTNNGSKQQLSTGLEALPSRSKPWLRQTLSPSSASYPPEWPLPKRQGLAGGGRDGETRERLGTVLGTVNGCSRYRKQ